VAALKVVPGEQSLSFKPHTLVHTPVIGSLTITQGGTATSVHTLRIIPVTEPVSFSNGLLESVTVIAQVIPVTSCCIAVPVK
jgi:hypothetical protein